jgi:hypothetical protein
MGVSAPEGAFESEDEMVGQQFKAPIVKMKKSSVRSNGQEPSINSHAELP